MLRHFGEKLRRLRHQHALSQAELARLLPPTSRGHINNLEVGRKEPSLDLALRIAALFGVTIDHLVCDAHTLVETPPLLNTNTLLPPRTHVGAKIQQLRQAAGKTQAELALALGLQTQSYISLVEHGQSDVSLKVVLGIAEVLGVSVALLVDDRIELASLAHTERKATEG